METLGPSPFVWLQFDENGDLTDGPSAMTALGTALVAAKAEDLVVLAHGWQTDRPGALGLYSRLWANVCRELASQGHDPSRFVVAGVLWPSKPYNADYDGGRALGVPLADGALAVDQAAVDDPDLPQVRFEQVLIDIQALLGKDKAEGVVEAARKVVGTADAAAPLAFFEASRAALGFDSDQSDSELAEYAALFDQGATPSAAENFLASYNLAFAVDVEPGSGAAKDLGARLSGMFEGARNGAAKALNLMSYYTMKERAGTIGHALGSNVLPELRSNLGVRLHLVGHSFGARLVTAAADVYPTGQAPELESLTLLQGAFSQNGMSNGKGPFFKVPDRVPGPIAVTHTHNDIACTVAYPMASFLVGDTTKAIGNLKNPFGAMGANGAQLKATQIKDWDLPGAGPERGKVNRYLADAFVKKAGEIDAHNNVDNESCGKLVARVITARA